MTRKNDTDIYTYSGDFCSTFSAEGGVTNFPGNRSCCSNFDGSLFPIVPLELDELLELVELDELLELEELDELELLDDELDELEELLELDPLD